MYLCFVFNIWMETAGNFVHKGPDSITFSWIFGSKQRGCCEEKTERELKFEANKPTGENGKGERWEKFIC